MFLAQTLEAAQSSSWSPSQLSWSVQVLLVIGVLCLLGHVVDQLKDVVKSYQDRQHSLESGMKEIRLLELKNQQKQIELERAELEWEEHRKKKAAERDEAWALEFAAQQPITKPDARYKAASPSARYPQSIYGAPRPGQPE